MRKCSFLANLPRVEYLRSWLVDDGSPSLHNKEFEEYKDQHGYVCVGGCVECVWSVCKGCVGGCVCVCKGSMCGCGVLSMMIYRALCLTHFIIHAA